MQVEIYLHSFLRDYRTVGKMGRNMIKLVVSVEIGHIINLAKAEFLQPKNYRLQD